jgi:hypothetical protein
MKHIKLFENFSINEADTSIMGGIAKNLIYILIK